MTAQSAALLQVGAIVGAHGLKGEVLLRVALDDARLLTILPVHTSAAAGASAPLKLSAVRLHVKGRYRARVEGVADRTAAEALVGTPLFVPAAEVPRAEDEILIAELTGFTAQYADGTLLGAVSGHFETAAHPVLEIASALTPDVQVLVPLVEEYVQSINEADRTLVLDENARQLEALAQETALTGKKAVPNEI